MNREQLRLHGQLRRVRERMAALSSEQIALESRLGLAPPDPALRSVLDAVGAVFGVSAQEMMSPTREWRAQGLVFPLR